MYYVMRASAPSLHRESTDSLILHQELHMINFNSLVHLGPTFLDWYRLG